MLRKGLVRQNPLQKIKSVQKKHGLKVEKAKCYPYNFSFLVSMPRQRMQLVNASGSIFSNSLILLKISLEHIRAATFTSKSCKIFIAGWLADIYSRLLTIDEVFILKTSLEQLRKTLHCNNCHLWWWLLAFMRFCFLEYLHVMYFAILKSHLWFVLYLAYFFAFFMSFKMKILQ